MHPTFVDTSIMDLLEADPRPSFIVALTPHPPTVVYTNPAFAAYPNLLDIITARSDDSGPLWEWITGTSTPAPSASECQPKRDRDAPSSLSYSNVYWTRSVVQEQMVVVGANEQIPASRSPRKVRLEATDLQPSTVSPPPRRSGSVEADKAAIAPEALLRPDLEPRTKSTPATVPIVPKERPPSRAEAVQSLGRAVSDPGWILPDTMPGTLYNNSANEACAI